MATAAEIANLKSQWVTDPCWDIEDTPGMQGHREELHSFREQMERQWSLERVERWEAKALTLGCPGNILLAQYVERLEERIARLEAQRV